ncbi:TRIM56 [Mytilus edulis]|uniref:TRIM56 n=1 Tax=Mytilus edulis TaxID=6550 RepID=A0A8S3QND3_MYTED|nr:TRIM56 [Mytilus edulis]
MAIAQDKTDNFDDLLTCTICLETFTAPKYLPCLHTFCKTCINTYILSTVDKEKTGTTFKCPICRQDVLMGESPGQPETWAEKLPEAFCESCEKCHKSFKMTGKHPIILLDDLVTNKETANISSLIYCEEHQGEVVKAYCVDHSKPLCTLCATLLHRKCEDVVTIETAVSGIKKSEKATKLSTELKETNKQLSDLIQNRKDLRTDYQKEAEFILTKVNEINNTLAAVSTDSSNIYTINTDDMTINRVLSNTFPSHGFCHINGEFILAHNNTLTWINSSTGVKTGQANTNGNTYYIYARERKNYICTDGTNTVSKIVNDIKVFAYTNDKLVSSRGVDVDTDGNVYICSFSSGNIHQLTKDGTLVRIISADSVGIKQPWVIRFKKNSNRFLVTCYNTGKVAVCEIV